jgi:hypothetical protein
MLKARKLLVADTIAVLQEQNTQQRRVKIDQGARATN